MIDALLVDAMMARAVSDRDGDGMEQAADHEVGPSKSHGALVAFALSPAL
ncbi:hypothetical protein [Mesorhizobium sp. A623]